MLSFIKIRIIKRLLEKEEWSEEDQDHIQTYRRKERISSSRRRFFAPSYNRSAAVHRRQIRPNQHGDHIDFHNNAHGCDTVISVRQKGTVHKCHAETLHQVGDGSRDTDGEDLNQFIFVDVEICRIATIKTEDAEPFSVRVFFSPKRREITELPPSPKISPRAIIRVKIGAPRETPATRLVLPVRAIKVVSTIL